MDSDIDLNIPTPQKHIASQQLLADGETSYHGYITKLKQLEGKGIAARFQSVKNILTPVRPVLVILNRGCLYYFKDDTSKKPSGSYTLYGYNRVFRAQDLQTEKRPWVFQMEHASPVMETLTFSTSTQKDMEKWMVAIKQEMIKANKFMTTAKHIADMGSDRPPADGKDESLSDFVEQPIYDDLSDVVYEVDKAIKKNPLALMGKNTDEDDDEDPPEYLEFDSAEPPPVLEKQRARSKIANELDKAFRKKSKDESKGKGRVPTVPSVPSKEDFDDHKKGPLPPIPGQVDIKGKKRSEPDGNSFKKALRTPTDNSKSQSSEKPSVAVKPQLLWKKKPSTEKAPELPPWKDKPDLPPPRRASEENDKPKLPKGRRDNSSSIPGDAPEPTMPVSPSKKPSITQEDVDKDPSLYWKCHFFEGTKEEGQALLAKLATDGVYLVRDGTVAGTQVLAVYWNKRTHKYVIRNEDGKYFLTSGNDSDLKAETLDQMLYHYHTNYLPNKGTKLTLPYQLALADAENT